MAEVMPGTPAEKAGLKRRDVIVAFNGKEVNSSRDLPAMVANMPVGQEATISVLRHGKTHEFPIMVSKLPSEQARTETPSPAQQGKWGFQLQDITPQMSEKRGSKLTMVPSLLACSLTALPRRPVCVWGTHPGGESPAGGVGQRSQGGVHQGRHQRFPPAPAETGRGQSLCGAGTASVRRVLAPLGHGDVPVALGLGFLEM